MSSFDSPLHFTHLNEWLAWLEQAHSIHKIELGLDRVKTVASRLDLLHPTSKIITVAGTNGKGTTVAAIEALASSHKLSVGTYTSPHLVEFNERIRINQENCNDELLVEGFKAVYTAKRDAELTYFEFTTLVGLWVFNHLELDLVVLEVGLGGRLDAVNIVDADIAVITSIGLDHTDWLGNDLKTIAREKAGVARHNKPLVIADSAIEKLLESNIEAIGCIPIIADKDYKAVLDKKYWSYSNQALSVEFYELPLNDLYLPNLAAALTAFSYVYQELLNKTLSYASCYKSYETLTLLGRFQFLSKQPHIIVDVAHNVDSAKLLNQKLLELKASGVERVVALCGMLKDKDADSCLNAMTAIDQWHFIDLPAPRGRKAKELLQKLPQMSQNNAKCYSSLKAFNESCVTHSCLKSSEALIVFGSFVTVGLFVDQWNKEGFAWI
ncbi:bifunctional folylpolyglutamate synthase/dihydrofolate synthase [Kangiella sediminilitoris]|uniref:Dihydrofolate synthase/folylpolyglutamate synthase n=1 Tax=Kangiella sediminilitoris TaxID=1144748 RepID=A0A1B3BA84_9GAMM|nr:folylpolyglutamate synthase/dihydrofolate synthase family protein [Kangiella sediminilitoris]AOE49730.1 FolC bifunctional protein [Kangiella sediminilitoris]